jgi:hypothetical protein
MTHAALNEALVLGQTLDLSEAHYGPPHWQGEFVAETAPYYRFLAGFVRHFKVQRAVELGTHYGGATIAMSQGFDPTLRDGARLATVDVTFLNEEGLAKHPLIQRFEGDSLDDDVVRGMMSVFEEHIDLLFVDTIHTYEQTLENLALYANRMKPTWIILDDIRLNPQMRALWRDLGHWPCGELIDLSDRVDRADAGFGLIVCRYPFQWPESSPLKRRALRAKWAARRALATRTPEWVKVGVRQGLRRLTSAG